MTESHICDVIYVMGVMPESYIDQATMAINYIAQAAQWLKNIYRQR